MLIDTSRELDVILTALDAEIQRVSSAHFELCVIGGAALNAIGLVSRPTRDVDVVALGSRDSGSLVLIKGRPLPEALTQAAAAVATQLMLEPGWLNAGPADLVDHGLPDGFEDGLISRTYGPALTVHFAGRLDQICFKTYAAADVAGRHLTDLKALAPDENEMRRALAWIADQDDSEGFRMQLSLLLEHMGMGHLDEER